jgi:hypothetical protein
LTSRGRTCSSRVSFPVSVGIRDPKDHRQQNPDWVPDKTQRSKDSETGPEKHGPLIPGAVVPSRRLALGGECVHCPWGRKRSVPSDVGLSIQGDGLSSADLTQDGVDRSTSHAKPPGESYTSSK